jgi:hypothetical protein
MILRNAGMKQRENLNKTLASVAFSYLVLVDYKNH